MSWQLSLIKYFQLNLAKKPRIDEYNTDLENMESTIHLDVNSA